MSDTLVVGDVHGCADELAAMLALTRPARLVLVGDLFTKGPDPLGVWALIQRWRAEAVLGNHDLHVLERWPRVCGELPVAALRWLEGRPLVLEEQGPRGPCVVVHAGLHPTEGVPATSPDVAVSVRRWPSGGEHSANPFWWELYDGAPLVIYGHDARRGLNDRRPRTLGLDSGCVYGGRLTGYLLEQDRLVEVPAARVYRAVD